MTFRSALLAATMMALPIVANAQAISGPYVGMGAGVNLLMNEEIKGGGELKSGVGPAVVVSLGYGFGNGLRAEVEGNYRYNAFNGGKNLPAGTTNIGGNEQKAGGMVNVLYDFVGMVPMVQPYVGAGFGYEAVIEHNLHRQNGAVSTNFGSDTKGSMAYQGIAGIAMPIESAPGLALTAEYRFMGLIGDRTYSGVSSNGARPSLKFTDNYNHSLLVGVRYAFNAAPAMAPMAQMPAAAPVPAAAVSRSYLVFFDWDKASLTDRARQIISEAAQNSSKVQYTKIDVSGYTDTSGTAQYNQGLSVRRAQAVAAELVKDGVPKNTITIQGFGQSNPLVPTGNGVREPQNRRVVIDIR